ncbi:MAG: hypothetical protein EOO57_00155 [Hymenobacter sp.]|nr:MAG: hypothetical protein EOO57_00155 [Hymenobacter sp.]
MAEPDKDLPLVVAEILIEMHGMNGRLTNVEKRLENVENILLQAVDNIQQLSKAVNRTAEVLLQQQQEFNRRFDQQQQESNRRFDQQQQESNQRFDQQQQESNRRFDQQQRESDRRFELQQESNRRFDQQQRESSQRFELLQEADRQQADRLERVITALDNRLERLENR